MVSPVNYVQEVVSELKKVSWPSPKQTRNMTMLVVIVSILVGVYIGALDFVFQKLVATLINL